MNLQQIEYLLALEKYRNFSVAAEKVFVTQPALTIQIKNLERELGVEIFDRNKLGTCHLKCWRKNEG